MPARPATVATGSPDAYFHGARVPQRGASVARAENVRRHNLSLVLRLVLEADVPPSRAEIAARTGLTRASVSSLVDVLLGAGLLSELAPVSSPGAGRPAVPLVGARGAVVGLGVEINVEYLGVRAIDLTGETVRVHVERGDFRGSEPARVLRQAAALTAGVARLVAEGGARSAGAGLALPGLFDEAAYRLRMAPNLGWWDVDIRANLAGTGFGDYGFVVGNEANLAARAEARVRPEERSSFIYVSGEVGVGGALVHAGEVFTGPGGAAGEIGHTAVDPSGPSCTCGSRGCLERYAGKDALFAGAGLAPDAPIDELAAAVGNGDPRAVTSVDHAGWALGVALSNVVNLVAIREVVLGGSFVPIAERLRPAISAELERRALLYPWQPVTIATSAAGDHPAMTGAALSVLERVTADPAAWGAV